MNTSMSKVLDNDETSVSSVSDAVSKPASISTATPSVGQVETEGDKLPWPTPSDLNTRLRRMITGYQRNHKRQLVKNAQKAKVCHGINGDDYHKSELC